MDDHFIMKTSDNLMQSKHFHFLNLLLCYLCMHRYCMERKSSKDGCRDDLIDMQNNWQMPKL
jgi:hypothetical protein